MFTVSFLLGAILFSLAACGLAGALNENLFLAKIVSFLYCLFFWIRIFNWVVLVFVWHGFVDFDRAWVHIFDFCLQITG